MARSTFVVARPTGLASSVGNAVMGLSSSSVTGRGYGLFMEAVSASTGLALRVGGSKVMGHSLSTVLPNLVSLASPASYIYEILIYEEFFSDESRQQIEDYLSSKWGID